MIKNPFNFPRITFSPFKTWRDSFSPVFYILIWGGGGYSTNFYTGTLRPEIQPLTLLYTIFHEKGTPFVYQLLTNGTPFICLVYNFASLLTVVNALSFK